MTRTRDLQGRVEVLVGPDGERRLVAARDFIAGDSMLYIHGPVTRTPNKYSVQVDVGLHVDVPPDEALNAHPERYAWRFLNHSCAPNGWIRGRELIALAPVRAGEELTFDYNTTEYAMACPFDCWCAARPERHRVQGYKYLDAAGRAALDTYLAPHLRAEREERGAPQRSGATAGRVGQPT